MGVGVAGCPGSGGGGQGSVEACEADVRRRAGKRDAVALGPIRCVVRDSLGPSAGRVAAAAARVAGRRVASGSWGRDRGGWLEAREAE